MASRPTPDFERLIAAVARGLAARDLPFMLIGGQAVLLHGEPRLTQDVEVTLGVTPDRIGTILDLLGELVLEPLPEDPAGFARETFVLPTIEPTSGIRVDFNFSTTAYERQAIDRAVRVDVAGEAVPFATAEDLILHKLFAAALGTSRMPRASCAGRGPRSTGSMCGAGRPSSRPLPAGRGCRNGSNS